MVEDRLADGELAERIVAGDRDAFETVFRQYGGAVRTIAGRVVSDNTLAEDVVQDTFVGFWKTPERFDPARGSLRTFLMTIAHRKAVDLVRSEVARTRREMKPPDPDHSDVADEVWSRQLSEQVRGALEDLTESEREAISLAYLGGLSYVETAKRLGQPEGTVKSRIRSGMRKLSVSLSAISS
ncbi:MAG: sigma-70 family RNA polymerase sigma factor [Acidimicrobiia bacterium]